jgi:hypothetical protein
MRERKPLPKRAPWYDYTSASSIGIEIVVAITLPTLGAYWLERNVTHWRPWTTLLGFATGCGAAVLALARVIRQHKMAVEAKKQAQAREQAESEAENEPDDHDS